eukprot:Lithocolla_globosa_v1_NODE_1288_length_2698_cov_11.370034.p3 type:complete len:107 gc:universal NODE_1288_length_2698_cov_11.370034:1536-1856(+)
MNFLFQTQYLCRFYCFFMHRKEITQTFFWTIKDVRMSDVFRAKIFTRKRAASSVMTGNSVKYAKKAKMKSFKKIMHIDAHRCTSMHIDAHRCTSMYIDVHRCRHRC